MKRNLLKLLPVLVAVMLVFSISLTALAEDESGKTDESTEVGAAESAVITTGDTSAAESETEPAAESGADSEPAAASADASQDGQEADDSGSSSVFVRHLPRWITLFVIIVLIVAAVVLARTKTKLGQKIAKFFRDYKSEIQKVSWYSPKETAKATGVVLVFLIALAVAIGVLDFLFTKGIELLASIF